ncbi:MAG: hypothetical protein ABFD90_01710 [Phycisphaerales bacterium]
MKISKRTRVWIAILVPVLAVESWAIYTLRPSAGRWRSDCVVKDEPAAHALYDQMIATMREAKTLSYKLSSSSPGEKARHYLLWLKKPNHFRVEAIDTRGEKTGTLVCDGNDSWIFWPGDCPRIDVEDTNIPREQWSSFYMTRHTPQGKHSIGHDVGSLGRGMHMPFIDPSTFHGYTDSLQPYIDGIANRGTDTVQDELCDVIEVSIMNAQRTWYFWLSKEDYLPRRAKQIIRGFGTSVDVEEWSQVTLDAEIPQDKFVWSPPEGWRVWVDPDPADKLLKPGTEAPQFALRSMAGGRIKLSDFRNEIVWLYIWRSG